MNHNFGDTIHNYARYYQCFEAFYVDEKDDSFLSPLDRFTTSMFRKGSSGCRPILPHSWRNLKPLFCAKAHQFYVSLFTLRVRESSQCSWLVAHL
jgi:hypothetical protein